MRSTDESIEQEIRELLDDAGIPVAVVVENRVARLIGPVDSVRLRDAAVDLASSVDRVRRVEDEMSYEVISPDMVTEPLDDDEQFGFADSQSIRDDIPFEDADFTAPEGTVDQIQAIEEGEPYFPPVDPVVEPGRTTRGLEVVGGFQGESTDDTDDQEERAFEESIPLDGDRRLIERDDDEIREDVLRELREDSETTELTLDIDVRRGIVYMRGRVQSLDDAENAEAVASRVPGVVGVEDRTETIEG